MKKIFVTVAITLATNLTIFAQKDSTRIVHLQEVQIVSTRANEKIPVAYTDISKKQLKKANNGQDITYLLNTAPSIITTSDAGAGIGYTTIRVRGIDDSRINFTVNGIPINDPEEQKTTYVNMPDLVSSVKNIQVQRGAGTSTNGAGAFGASVNIQTDNAAMNPYAEVNGSYGSYNTHKETVKFGTGLLNNHWTFDGRLSNISTDGYIDRAFVKLNSYYMQVGYFIGSTSIKFINFTGKEETYHAWNYASKEEMTKYGRTYNSCGKYTDDEGHTKYYKNQTDNYLQSNNQLLFNHEFSQTLNLNVALHYTRGKGYYEEYKTKKSLVEYGLTPYTVDETLVKKSDLVRRKQMANDFYGTVFSLNYKNDKLTASFGGALNQYKGNHFGKVIWVKNYIGSLDPDHQYYKNNTKKTDGNIYLKATYNFTNAFSAYGDVQYRHIKYTINGKNSEYDWNTGKMQPLNIDKDFNFFNPKFGLNLNINRNQRIYASLSVAQKEPTRNCYTDGVSGKYPKSEKLLDYEFGYHFANSLLNAGINLYYMDYTDQLVYTGALNDTGEAITDNVANSYRTGAELTFGIKPCNWFQWNINGTLSKNRAKNYKESIPVTDDDYNVVSYKVINHKSSHLTFSPDLILKNNFSANYKGFEADLQSQYVGKQYLTNGNVEDLTIDKYFVSDLNMSYTFKPKKTISEVTIGFTIYNLFNEEYENNGWASREYEPGHTDPVESSGYAAQAGTHVMGHLNLRF